MIFLAIFSKKSAVVLHSVSVCLTGSKATFPALGATSNTDGRKLVIFTRDCCGAVKRFNVTLDFCLFFLHVPAPATVIKMYLTP